MTLEEFIDQNTEPRELKRALAVKMRRSGYTHRKIPEILNVASSFISKWEQRYIEQGVEGLKLGYKGRKSYLSSPERKEVIKWLKQKGEWELDELIEYLQKQYQVGYSSLQSYYQLFSDAGISWHKGVKKNPKQDWEQVKTVNLEIHELLEKNHLAIESSEIAVFVIDECHLMSGDICGYGWGDCKERRTVENINYRDRQTYYGAVDLVSQELLIKKAKTANGTETVNFVEYLQSQRPNSRLILIWDGASYHRGQEFQHYLAKVNHQCLEDCRQIHCQRFAPYAPSENPIENIWSQVKNFLKRFHRFCKSFLITKRLFELFINYHLFTMPDLNKYDAFSHLF